MRCAAGKTNYLGAFADEESAAEAYDLATVMLRAGEQHTWQLNFPGNLPRYKADAASAASETLLRTFNTR